ncbi:MAG: hypothetical protein WDW38_010092 [Sanguina aurantia]
MGHCCNQQTSPPSAVSACSSAVSNAPSQAAWTDRMHRMGSERSPITDGNESSTSTPPTSSLDSNANSSPNSLPGDASASSNLLQDPSFLSTGFGFLSATSALIAFPALLAPELLLDPVFHPSSGVDPGEVAWILEPLFLRVAGATLLISAAVEYCLMDAAANSRLSSPTYARLMAGCSIKSMLYLATFASLPQLWSNPLACIAYLPTASASLLLNSAALARSMSPTATATGSSSSGGGGGGGSSRRHMSCMSPLSTTVVVFVTPEGAAETTVALLLKRTWAPGFWLAAVACVSLGDAAERGRLGASTFRSLHSGLICLELSYSMLLAAAIATNNAVADPPTISSGAGAFGIAAFAAYQLVVVRYKGEGKANEMKDDAKDAAKDVQNKVEDASDRAGDKARSVADQVKGAARDVGDNLRDAVDNVSGKAERTADEVSSKAERTADRVQGGPSTACRTRLGTPPTACRARQTGRGTRALRRAQIRGNAADIGDRAQNTADRAASKADNVGGRLAEGFQEIGDAAKGAVGSIGDNLKASASSAASDVQSVGESIRVSADLAGQDPEVSNRDC